MSHAFVEVNSEAIASAILRGEVEGSDAGTKRVRGSVLGKGRRARGVTVTRSSQEELMAAVSCLRFSLGVVLIDYSCSLRGVDPSMVLILPSLA